MTKHVERWMRMSHHLMWSCTGNGLAHLVMLTWQSWPRKAYHGQFGCNDSQPVTNILCKYVVRLNRPSARQNSKNRLGNQGNTDVMSAPADRPESRESGTNNWLARHVLGVSYYFWAGFVWCSKSLCISHWNRWKVEWVQDFVIVHQSFPVGLSEPGTQDKIDSGWLQEWTSPVQSSAICPCWLGQVPHFVEVKMGRTSYLRQTGTHAKEKLSLCN